MDESEFEEKEDPEIAAQKQEIQDEINAVQAIIDVASRISSNAKVTALKTALRTAFAQQEKDGISEVVLTAWSNKFDQAYQKAKISFGGDPDFRKIQDLYDAKMREIENAKSKSKRW